MTFSIKLDTKPVVDTLESLHHGLSNLKGLHEILVIEGQKYIFKHWPKSPALKPLTLSARISGGSQVLLDTGTLRGSITGKNSSVVSTEPKTLNEASDSQSVVGTSVPWATAHNFGATIVPRRAKSLAVPATPEAARARGPRNFPEKLYFVPSKKPNCLGVLVTYGRAAKGQKRPMTIQYILLKSVTLAQRKFMPTAEEFASTASRAAGAYLAFLLLKKGG